MPYTSVNRAPVTPVIDLTGQTFGRLLVIVRAGSNRHGNAEWVCRCVCGNTIIRPSGVLRRGNTKSCGCLKREVLSSGTNTTHGHSKKGRWSPEYTVWTSMLGRCLNAKATNFERYGGAGVIVCERWLTFSNFLADMGPRPYRYTLERIDNVKGYSPDNCRWATYLEQAHNTRKNVNLTALGKTQCVAAWARELNVTVMRIHRWIHKGLSLEDFIARVPWPIPK